MAILRDATLDHERQRRRAPILLRHVEREPTDQTIVTMPLQRHVERHRALTDECAGRGELHAALHMHERERVEAREQRIAALHGES